MYVMKHTLVNYTVNIHSRKAFKQKEQLTNACLGKKNGRKGGIKANDKQCE